MLSCSLFTSPCCHATFIALRCSPHDWALLYMKRTLHMLQTMFTLQICEATVKQTQRWSKFIKFVWYACFSACFMFQSCFHFLDGVLQSACSASASQVWTRLSKCWHDTSAQEVTRCNSNVISYLFKASLLPEDLSIFCPHPDIGSKRLTFSCSCW